MGAKKITIKQWLHYSSTRSAASAIGFLDKYREWLETSEVKPIAAPILAQINAGTLMPTPALDLLKEAINAYQNQKALAEVEAKLAAKVNTTDDTKYKPRKNWQAIIYDPKGNIVSQVNAQGKMVDLDESFELNQRASEWADRRLFECEPNSYAVITHTPTNAIETIERGHAISRIMRGKKSPAVRVGQPSSALSFGCKVHQTRVTFSGG